MATASSADDTEISQFTMKLARGHRRTMIANANDAGVTASDWIRAWIELSKEDPILAERVAERARQLRAQAKKKTGTTD